ncbi:hypothetical protein [Tranquillimonas rosea]|nr:hypothetical protein [Tranquillimonas rosea]
MAIGHREFAEALGVKPSAVSNMKSSNRIPAKKYLLVCQLCGQHELSPPDCQLFTFDPGGEEPAEFLDTSEAEAS